MLDNGRTLCVNHVVLTSGHTWNEESGPTTGGVRYLRPYPVEHFDHHVAPGAPIAVAGMGLVGFDLLTALTVGRGGTYKDSGDHKGYVRAAGNRRSTCTPVPGSPTAPSPPTESTPTATTDPSCARRSRSPALTNPGGSPVRRQVDFRHDLLPLLFAEMQARFLTHAALLKGGEDESSDVRRRLTYGWMDGGFDDRRGVVRAGLRSIRPGHPRVCRYRSPLPFGRRLPGSGLRHDRDRPRRGAGRWAAARSRRPSR